MGEIGPWRFNEQMVMVVHEAVRMTYPDKSIDHEADVFQKALAILVIKEDVLTSIASTSDMIKGAFKLDSKWTCHGKRIA